VIDNKTKNLLSARMAVGQPQLCKLTERYIKCLIVQEATQRKLEDLNSTSAAKRKEVLMQSKMGAGETKKYLLGHKRKFEILGKFYRLCSDTMADFLASEFASNYHEKTGKAILSLANEYDISNEKKRGQIEKKVQSMQEGFLVLIGEGKGKKFTAKADKRKYFLDLLAKSRASAPKRGA